MRVDLHMHTEYSVDAASPQSVADKVRACVDAGLDIIGITDHLDFFRTRGPSENRVLEIEAHGGFDVLAHIDYPLRVMKHGDYVPSFDHYMDRVEQVLRACIDHGYALELNAAGLGGWMKKVGPPQDILYEYRRMGGERISIGSDSHALDNVGRGFDDCVKNARNAGFTSVTVFRERKPEQVALG